LLDRLGAVIDHVEAHISGGASDIANLATACNKCNGRKSNARAEEFTKRHPLIPVKENTFSRLGRTIHPVYDSGSEEQKNRDIDRVGVVSYAEKFKLTRYQFWCWYRFVICVIGI
jgi:hypothetical protein